MKFTHANSKSIISIMVLFLVIFLLMASQPAQAVSFSSSASYLFFGMISMMATPMDGQPRAPGRGMWMMANMS
jgi:hypothetical protein